MAYLHTRPYALHGDEGQNHCSLGASISIKATSEQTGGMFNLFDISFPPDYATPLHIHYREDVAIFILEGALTIFWGSERKNAAVGSFFYQPRGTPHGFRVQGGKPARILYMTIPAGFDQFVIEQEMPTLTTEPETEAARYKIEILRSLPD